MVRMLPADRGHPAAGSVQQACRPCPCGISTPTQSRRPDEPLSPTTSDTVSGDDRQQLPPACCPALMTFVCTVFMLMLPELGPDRSSPVVFLGLMLLVVRKRRQPQPRSLRSSSRRPWAALNGYIEEMIEGQKVVKVFCHEQQAMEEFDRPQRGLSRRPPPRPRPIAGIHDARSWATSATHQLRRHLLRGRRCWPSAAVFDAGHPGRLPAVCPAAVPAHQPDQSSRSTPCHGRWPARSASLPLMDEEPETDEGYVTLVNARRRTAETLTETDRAPATGPGRSPTDGRPCTRAAGRRAL